MRRWRRRDFAGDTVDVARRLLGAVLVHDGPDGRTAGRIVETEAYLSQGDGASHSACGPTARNASMFLNAGHAYVYRIYGVHLCFNVVTGSAGVGEAVLVRALEPMEGDGLMARRRQRSRALELCRGPGRATQAMGISQAQDGDDLVRGSLGIFSSSSGSQAVTVGTRVGIGRSVHLPLRFAIRGSRWVSLPACEDRRDP